MDDLGGKPTIFGNIFRSAEVGAAIFFLTLGSMNFHRKKSPRVVRGPLGWTFTKALGLTCKVPTPKTRSVCADDNN